MENRIEFYPEWREGDTYGVVAWASWNLNGDIIVEYIERDFTPSMWFWDKYFVDLLNQQMKRFVCLIFSLVKGKLCQKYHILVE